MPDRESLQSGLDTEPLTTAGNAIDNVTISVRTLAQDALAELAIQFSNATEVMGDFSSAANKAVKSFSSGGKGAKTWSSGMVKATAENLKFTQSIPQIINSISSLNNNLLSIGLNFNNIFSNLNSHFTKLAGGITKFGAIGMVASAGIGLITSAIQFFRQQELERQKAFEEGIQKTREYAQSVNTLQNNINILKNEKSTVEELTQAKTDLAAAFPELVMGYTSENEAILTNISNIEDYIKVLKLKEDEARLDIISNGKGAGSNAINEQKEQIKSYEEYLQQLEGMKESGLKFVSNDLAKSEWGIEGDNTPEQAIAKIKAKISEADQEILKLTADSKEYNDAVVKGHLKIADSNGNLVGTYQDMNDTQKKVYSEMMTGSGGLLEQIASNSITAEEAADSISKVINNTVAMESYKKALEDMNLPEIDVTGLDTLTSELNELSNAYQTLNSGQSLSIDQLNNLIEKYPQVAQYLAETNDLSLDNGKILEQVYKLSHEGAVQKLRDDLKDIEVQQAKQSLLVTDLELSLSSNWDNPEARSRLQSSLNNARGDLQDSLNKINEAKAKIRIMETYSPTLSLSGSKSSGSGSGKNQAVSNELKQLDQKKKMDQLTTQQEYDNLVRISKQYKMSADEKADLDYRIYQAKKKLEEEAEKAATERLNAEYKAMENKKKLGELTLEEELAWLEKIQKTFKMNKEEQMDLEIKLYDLRKELHEKDVETLDSLGDVVTEALKKQYEEQQKQEEKRINDSIESWQKWEEDTCGAIQGQIDALDELEKEQDSAEKRAEYERKRQAAALQLAYEKDEYNRRQLQMELNRLDQEEQKRLDQEARDAERERLEAELDKVKEDSQKQQDSLQEELDKLKETYEDLTSDFKLRAEAEKAIMNSTQQEIVDLIKSYAPEYDLAGQSIGEKLVEGFKSKVGGIVQYFEAISKQMEEYQKNLAYTANQAADEFWAGRKAYEQQIAAAAASSQPAPVSIEMQVNFNQPIQSPIEVRRELDRVAENLARRIGG